MSVLWMFTLCLEGGLTNGPWLGALGMDYPKQTGDSAPRQTNKGEERVPVKCWGGKS